MGDSPFYIWDRSFLAGDYRADVVHQSIIGGDIHTDFMYLRDLPIFPGLEWYFSCLWNAVPAEYFSGLVVLAGYLASPGAQLPAIGLEKNNYMVSEKRDPYCAICRTDSAL